MSPLSSSFDKTEGDSWRHDTDKHAPETGCIVESTAYAPPVGWLAWRLMVKNHRRDQIRAFPSCGDGRLSRNKGCTDRSRRTPYSGIEFPPISTKLIRR